MPRFYFHLRGPMGLERDDTGLEFVGIEAAYLEACRTIPEMSADFAYEAENPARYTFEIGDPDPMPIMILIGMLSWIWSPSTRWGPATRFW